MLDRLLLEVCAAPAGKIAATQNATSAAAHKQLVWCECAVYNTVLHCGSFWTLLLHAQTRYQNGFVSGAGHWPTSLVCSTQGADCTSGLHGSRSNTPQTMLKAEQAMPPHDRLPSEHISIQGALRNHAQGQETSCEHLPASKQVQQGHKP
jgi:hypothetical protein